MSPSESFHDQDLRAVARVAVREFVNSPEFGDVMTNAISTALLRAGIDTSDPAKNKRDFAHLRTWSETMEVVRDTGIRTLVRTAVTGAIASFMVGVGYFLYQSPRPH